MAGRTSHYDHDIRNIVPDRKRAKLVASLYEKFAGGEEGLVTMSELLFENGIKCRAGKRWSKSAVQKFLTNRLYIGVMEWGEKTFEGKYVPIIKPEIFAAVQRALKKRSKPRRVHTTHAFPFRGLFACTCGSMVTAQWARGNGGSYRYYRCTRKIQACSEKYLQEHTVAEQCAELLRPLAVSSDDANSLRTLIDENGRMNDDEREKYEDGIVVRLVEVQKKINRLTRAFIDEKIDIDEESHRMLMTELVMEKQSLKAEKRRFRERVTNSWIEPAKAAVEALEMALKVQFSKSPEEISNLVRRVGTNRYMSSKQVRFEFSEPYRSAASILALRPIPTPKNLSSRSDEIGQPDRSTIMCSREDLNLHELPHALLRRTRLPIPPREQWKAEYARHPVAWQ